MAAARLRYEVGDGRQELGPRLPRRACWTKVALLARALTHSLFGRDVEKRGIGDCSVRVLAATSVLLTSVLLDAGNAFAAEQETQGNEAEMPGACAE